MEWGDRHRRREVACPRGVGDVLIRPESDDRFEIMDALPQEPIAITATLADAFLIASAVAISGDRRSIARAPLGPAVLVVSCVARRPALTSVTPQLDAAGCSERGWVCTNHHLPWPHEGCPAATRCTRMACAYGRQTLIDEARVTRRQATR